jgi:phage N-6-adenine-methyltransferase
MTQYINPAKSCEWGTPQKLFDELDAEFYFTLDACASKDLAKCDRFFDSQENALQQPWDNTTFCNPPYGPAIAKWIQKAYQESLRGKTVVMLIPARTDTIWFHAYCLDKSVEVRFLKGRLAFSGKGRAPFPSMIVIFRGR